MIRRGGRGKSPPLRHEGHDRENGGSRDRASLLTRWCHQERREGQAPPLRHEGHDRENGGSRDRASLLTQWRHQERRGGGAPPPPPAGGRSWILWGAPK